jgi:hypothetical protein
MDDDDEEKGSMDVYGRIAIIDAFYVLFILGVSSAKSKPGTKI